VELYLQFHMSSQLVQRKKYNRKSYPIITFLLKNYCTDVHYIWYNNNISCLLHLRPVTIGRVSDGYRIRLRIKN